MNNKKFILIGLIFIPLSIFLGALAAHYLEKIGMASSQIATFEVGVRYLFYAGVAFLALAGIVKQFDFNISIPYRFILWGSVLFSGSIFALVLLPRCGIHINQYIGVLTPLGGLLMIAGWVILLILFLRTYKS